MRLSGLLLPDHCLNSLTVLYPLVSDAGGDGFQVDAVQIEGYRQFALRRARKPQPCAV